MLCLFASGCGSNVDDEQPTKNDAENGIEKVSIEMPAQLTLDMIPDSPIKGGANGVEFIAQAIYFEPLFGQWCMVISDTALSSPTGILTEGQSVHIYLSESLEAGMVYSKELSYGDGYFQIRKQNDSSTTSWNADNAYILMITKWEVGAYDPEGDLFQLAGKASGKLFIIYSGEGMDDFENSWIAGTFKDVPVRYMGEPDFE